MKKILTITACILLVGCSIFSPGGKFENYAGKFLASTALTVDATMKAYAKAQVSGMTTSQQDASVKTAYGQYQTYFSLATNAYTIALVAGDTTVFPPASNNLYNAKTTLTLAATTK